MTGQGPDIKPWTPLEIGFARLANAAEDAAKSLRAFVAAWDDVPRRDHEARRQARHRRQTATQQRMNLLRTALRDGTVRWQ